MYSRITHDIRVSVEPQFMPERSDPRIGQFFWAYTVTIENTGGDAVQLLRRHWRITDANGMLREVRGDGVVGETPVLQPGDSFTYTSGCPLPTPQGIMVGQYEMERADGTLFRVDVPAFSLDSPSERRTLN